MFFGVTFRAKFEVVLQKQFVSVIANKSHSNFSTLDWVADSEEIRLVYSTKSLSNHQIREVNSTEIDSIFTSNCTEREIQDYAPLQRWATNRQTNSHNYKKLTWNYLQWLFCHLKVNRDKLALINRLSRYKNSERLIIANSFTKIDHLEGFRPLWRPEEKISPAPGTNQIAGFVEFRPLTSWEKDDHSYFIILWEMRLKLLQKSITRA